MSPKPPRPPSNLQTLRRITDLANELERPVRRVQRAVANTVVGQMLPHRVVKGGRDRHQAPGEWVGSVPPARRASLQRRKPSPT